MWFFRGLLVKWHGYEDDRVNHPHFFPFCVWLPHLGNGAVGFLIDQCFDAHTAAAFQQLIDGFPPTERYVIEHGFHKVCIDMQECCAAG